MNNVEVVMPMKTEECRCNLISKIKSKFCIVDI